MFVWKMVEMINWLPISLKETQPRPTGSLTLWLGFDIHGAKDRAKKLGIFSRSMELSAGAGPHEQALGKSEGGERWVSVN